MQQFKDKFHCFIFLMNHTLRFAYWADLEEGITHMSCTPRCISCTNSKNLFTTVSRNFQWALKNLGYWPTTHMVVEAMIVLLS